MLRLKLQYFGHLKELTHWKSWLIGKDLDAGKDQEKEEKEKGMTEDKMVGMHHQLNEFE